MSLSLWSQGPRSCRRPARTPHTRADNEARPSVRLVRTLLVEDDDGVADALGEVLGSAGWDVTRCSRGDDGLQQMDGADLVLLDLGLPDMDGLDFLRVLRRASGVPVIVLTARDSDGAIVLGLRAGADDYLVKPVRKAVLMARIDAVMRRVAPAPLEARAVMILGRLEVDRVAREVRRDGATLSLTATEFAVLYALAARPGEAVSREEVLLAVWGTPVAGRSRSLDYFIARLRAKLGDDLPLETVRGFGFRLAR